MEKIEAPTISMQERLRTLADENRELRQKLDVMRPAYIKLMQHQGLPVTA